MNATIPILNAKSVQSVKQAQPVKSAAQSRDSVAREDSFDSKMQEVEARESVAKSDQPADNQAVEDLETAVAEAEPNVAEELTGEEPEAVEAAEGVMVPVMMAIANMDASVQPIVEENVEPKQVIIAEQPVITEAKSAETAQVQQAAAQPQPVEPFVKQVMQEMDRALNANKDAQLQAQPQGEALESESQVVRTVMTQQSGQTQADTQSQTQTQAGERTAETTVLNTPLTGQPVESFATVMNETPQTADVQLETPEVRQIFETRLIEQVTTAVSTDKSELYLQLKPEHLGGLSIALTMTEEGLSAKLTTSSASVQSVLNADMAALSAALREKGINVVQMEVIYDQSAQMSTQDFSGREAFYGGGQQSQTRGGMEATTLDLREEYATYMSLMEPESSREYNA